MTTSPLTHLQAAIALSNFNANQNLPVATSAPMLVNSFLAPPAAAPLDSATPELLSLLCARVMSKQQGLTQQVWPATLQKQMGGSLSCSNISPKSGTMEDAAAALLLSRLSGAPMAYMLPLKPVAAANPDMASLAGLLSSRSYAASATTPLLSSPRHELQEMIGSMMPGSSSPTGSQLMQLPALGAKRSFCDEDCASESVQGSTKRMAIANILSSRGGWGAAARHVVVGEEECDAFHKPTIDVASRSSSSDSLPSTSPAQAPSRASSGLETEEGGSSKGGAAFLRFLRSMENRGVVVRRLQGEGHNEEVVGWTVVEGRMEDWRRLRKEWFMEGKQGKPYKPNSMYQVMRRLGFFPTLQTRRASHGYDFDYSDTYVLDNSKRYVQSYARGGSHSPRTPSSPPASCPS